jgi:hypothetical protein
MEISSIIQGTNLVEIINSTSNSSSVKRINEVNLKFDAKNFEKYFSSDQKAVTVTENSESYSNPAVYNYQFQTNTPASKIISTTKPFNEANKINNYEDTESEDDDSNDSYVYEQTEEISNTKTGSGYYIIINGPVDMPENNLLEKFTTEIQKRINKTYHLEYFREPGTLVDLVF